MPDNPISSPKYFNLAFSRNNQRGYSKHSSGAVHRVTWSGTHLQVNSVNVIPWATAPVYLDFSYDQNDRPQIVWKAQDQTVYLYFYNIVLTGYETLNLGTIPDQPIIHNDFLLGLNNTYVAYLKDQYPYYRKQSDRYTVEYLWKNRQYQGIKGFGYALGANTVSLILGYPPIPPG
jgi:hypothetical protein